MKNEIGDFLDYLTYERNVSINTVAAYRDDLESFTGFLSKDYLTMARDLLDLRRVDHIAIRSYLAHLARKKLRRSSIARHLSALRSFFKFLMREELVDSSIDDTPKLTMLNKTKCKAIADQECQSLWHCKYNYPTAPQTFLAASARSVLKWS